MYKAQMFDGNGQVLSDPAVFTATWPRLNLTLPNSHIAQEDVHPALMTRLIDDKIACRPSFETEVDFRFEV